MARRASLLLLVLVACSSPKDPPPAALPAVDAGTGGCSFKGNPEAPLPAPGLHTPRWAFRPWISKDISDHDDTYAFIKGFEERDIPTGVLVLDSPWATNYNTFVLDPKRYGAFAPLADYVHGKGLKLVLWTTQMVNQRSWDFEPGGNKYDGESPNYAQGDACKFYVDDGKLWGWWKGEGAAVDFFNPRARAWWHAQQRSLLDLGLDGWKLDFGDSYLREDVVQTADGPKPHQAYSEEYYKDFLAYGRSVRGPEFLTMVRPWDESYDFKGRFFARREHAPVGWVGDNKRNWAGLADALDEIFRSANAGYPVLGSDIGGYLDLDDKTLEKIPADTLNFARWTATMAMMPFFQLHGRANFAPWTVPDHVDETVSMYRYWAKLHDALVPFYYSLAEEAWAKGGSIVRPIGAESEWAGDFRYRLGDAFLVAPYLDATGKRSVALPAGDTWYDWFNADTDPIVGGKTVKADDSVGRARLPLFVRGGAIVPVDVVDDTNGLGTTGSKGANTVLYYPGATTSSFVLHEEDGAIVTLTGEAATLSFSQSAHVVRARIRVDVAATKPVSAFVIDAAGLETKLTEVITRTDFEAQPTAVFREPATRSVWVKAPPSKGKFTIAVR